MRNLLFAALFFAASLNCPAQTAQLSPQTEQQVAEIATRALHDTGVPSASIAIVQNQRVVYARAFGLANVSPARPATADMAYPIGSVSKQFTASAILLLQQRGKLSIDDPVAKYFPNFTRANQVTLRNLLTMTSGYEDYYPQDYMIPAMRSDTDPLALATAWATKPLDFTPGAEWQYSNTNYIILGLIVQKVSGQPFAQFLRENVLDPLHLQGVLNAYTQRDKLQATGYVSNSLAPVRVQPLEGNGWAFADGDLAMPASTLATWDIGIMQQKLLSPASYKLFETPFILTNGDNSHYGLGTEIYNLNGHRELEHSGEVGGYVSENMVFPEDGVAVVVLTNQVASSAAHRIAAAIAQQILPGINAPPPPPDTLAPHLKTILDGLQQGNIDRSLFTANANDYFSADAISDFKSTLAPLGTITDISRTRTDQRGGMTFGVYHVTYSSGTTLTLTTYTQPDGKIEQLLIIAKS